MEKEITNKFASEIFDTFVAVCTKYKIDFSVASSDDKAFTTSPVGGGEQVSKVATAEVATDKVKGKARKIYAPGLVTEFIKWFCTTPVDKLYKVKCGRWSCSCVDGTWMVTFATKDSHMRNSSGASGPILAFKPVSRPDLVMMNGGRFAYAGGHRWGVTRPQSTVLEAGAMPLPLRLIVDSTERNESDSSSQDGLGKKIEDIEVIDWTGQEKITVKKNRNNYQDKSYLETRHFAGGAIVKIEDDYFLLDADRQELEYFRFNAFFTKLPSMATTVKEAYDVLIPKELRGKEHVRQGELFFAPVSDNEVKNLMKSNASKEGQTTFDDTYAMIMSLVRKAGKEQYSKNLNREWNEIETAMGKDPIIDNDSEIYARLERLYKVPATEDTDEYANSNSINQLDTLVTPVGFAGSYHLEANHNVSLGVRPEDNRRRWGEWHQVTLLFNPMEGVYYAHGAVTHNQHHPVMLDQWYRIYKNSAAGNWNVTGEID